MGVAGGAGAPTKGGAELIIGREGEQRDKLRVKLEKVLLVIGIRRERWCARGV